MHETSAAGLALEVVRRLRTSGHAAYFVGGCVRDLLLRRKAKDFDISTSATPGQVLELFPGANHVGAHFGVMLVRSHEMQVEVATFRSDHAYEDGRRPSHVLFESAPRADVLRRDFTVNALMMDPETGEVLDYVNGRADLDAGIIRAIGDADARFAEDHLRMLRAVRFAARLGFAIERDTLTAIQKRHAAILRVSAERIRDELIRILTEGNARRGFELLDEAKLLGDILPELKDMQGVQQPPEYHPEGDVWTHTLMMLEGLRNPSPALAFGVLLHDVGKPPTFRIAPDRIRFDGHVDAGVEIARRVLRRLNFSNADSEQVLSLVENHMKFIDVPRMRDSTLKRFLRMDRFEEHLELHRLDCENSNRNLTTYEFTRAKLNEHPPEKLKPPGLVGGAGLIAAGYAPGPRFTEILRALEDAQLDGEISTREEALSLVAKRWPL